MLRHAFASAPTDSALINLCCAPQTSGQSSLPEFVLRAEKALEVHCLLATNMQCHLYVFGCHCNLIDQTELALSGGAGGLSKPAHTRLLGELRVRVLSACLELHVAGQ